MDDFTLLSLGPLILAAQALYYALYWILGGREGRIRAVEGFERVVISAVLFGVALAVHAIIAAGVRAFSEAANVTGPAVRAYSSASSLEGLASATRDALGAAEATYREYFDAAKDSMTAFFWAVFITGLLPWTQPLSMAIMSVFTTALAVLSSVLVSAAVYAAAVTVAKSWPALVPVGAVLIAHERTRNLGALLMAAGAVIPPVIAVGADVLRQAAPPERLRINWQLLVGAVGDVWHAAHAVVIMGLVGALAGALVYAFTRLFDHAGSHLSLD
jgi:hypothetical protein